ncbi:MAG: NAD-dependent DNA ligase LigA, partial [Patescibacteria group bacterium]
NEINHHRYLYHVLNRQEISDAALDSLKHELSTIEKEHPELITPDSPTQRVAGRALAGFKKVRHKTPMLSLNDAFSEEEVGEWEERIKKLAPDAKPDYFAELKIDGFAVSLTYTNGFFTKGSTRGDGNVGEDVTVNLKTIESIPLILQSAEDFGNFAEVRKIFHEFPRVASATAVIPQKLEIRGEVYMRKSAFESINREQKKKGLALFANPRNIAAGSMRQLDPAMAASRKLDFLAYDVVGDLGQYTHEEEHLIARCFGFTTVDMAERCDTRADIIDFWKRVLHKREKLDFLIDGIVVQVNSGDLFTRLGVAGKAPRGAIAFKFPAEEATSMVEDIIVQVGRTGVLTPVAVLKPVQVGGVVVSRATLHNIDEITRLDVRVGDTVIVRRAGDVIPDIVKVLKNMRPRLSKPFHMPVKFCGQRVVRRKGEAAHKILYPEKCELVQRERLYHFVSKGAFDIAGLGPKIIDRLIDEGLVQDPADLFTLKETDIKELERFGEKSAEHIIASIQHKKKIELYRLIYGLGILHVGEETALDLAAHFGTLEALVRATREDFERIFNIGSVVARSIEQWLESGENKKFLTKLIRVGISALPAQKSHIPQTLKGLTFVLTGTLSTLARDEAKRLIRQRGGNISESVSKSTDFCIVGADPGSKADMAEKLGVKIIDEKKFLKLTDGRH